MKKTQSSNYKPSLKRQQHLLNEQKDILTNRRECPIQANRTVTMQSLSPAGYVTLGLLFSSVILPAVRTQEQTTPLTNRNANILDSITGCENVASSLQNTTSRAGCMLVEGNSTLFDTMQHTAFGNTTVERQKKPSSAGINYRSSSLMEICVNKSTALALNAEGLCSSTFQDPFMQYHTTEGIYREHQQSPQKNLLPEDIQCSRMSVVGLTASESVIRPVIKEEECLRESSNDWKTVNQYEYPEQDKRTAISPHCPSSLAFFSDGVVSKNTIQTRCIPTDIHYGKSLCQDTTVSKEKECATGLVTNSQDCILGSRAYTVLHKACPRVKIIDMRLVHHQLIGANKTIPMMSATSLIKAFDTLVQEQILPSVIYITHPGSQIYTTQKTSNVVQGYIDRIKELGCFVVLDMGNQLKSQSDIFSSLKNILVVNSMKEALEDDSLPKASREAIVTFMAALLGSGIVLATGLLCSIKIKQEEKENEEQEDSEEGIPLNERTIGVIQEDSEDIDSVEDSLINTTEECIEVHPGYEEDEESINIPRASVFFVDEEEETSDSLFMKTRGLTTLEMRERGDSSQVTTRLEEGLREVVCGYEEDEESINISRASVFFVDEEEETSDSLFMKTRGLTTLEMRERGDSSQVTTRLEEGLREVVCGYEEDEESINIPRHSVFFVDEEEETPDSLFMKTRGLTTLEMREREGSSTDTMLLEKIDETTL